MCYKSHHKARGECQEMTHSTVEDNRTSVEDRRTWENSGEKIYIYLNFLQLKKHSFKMYFFNSGTSKKLLLNPTIKKHNGVAYYIYTNI